MIRILSILGTRPEAIKMAPLLRELARREDFRSLLCVTGQHRELLRQALDAFELSPDRDLALMTPGQDPGCFLGAALPALQEVVRETAPDLVLVHGDTVSTLAGALAGFFCRVPVGHVEAGLRSGDTARPFPEEMSRRLVDALSALHFAPTAPSSLNLLREGLRPEGIFVTGNTVVDALALTVRPDFGHPALDWARGGGRFVLLTAHRRESWGEPLRQIFRAVRRAAEEFDELRVLCCAHPNPAVRGEAEAILGPCPRVKLLEPPDVLVFHNLLARAALVLTDSGGVQEEACALGVPTLVLRERTERPEGVEAGTLRLAGIEEEGVYTELCRLLRDETALAAMRGAPNPYGDGQASRRIAEAIAGWRRDRA